MHATMRKTRQPVKIQTRPSTPPKPFPGRHFGWALLRKTGQRGH